MCYICSFGDSARYFYSLAVVLVLVSYKWLSSLERIVCSVSVLGIVGLREGVGMESYWGYVVVGVLFFIFGVRIRYFGFCRGKDWKV